VQETTLAFLQLEPPVAQNLYPSDEVTP
jgi:hypothetical protein